MELHYVTEVRHREWETPVLARLCFPEQGAYFTVHHHHALIYDSRNVNCLLGFDPTCAHESHQTVLTALECEVNRDLVEMIIDDQTSRGERSETPVMDYSVMFDSIELYTTKDRRYTTLLTWENRNPEEKGTSPTIVACYVNFPLACAHFNEQVKAKMDAVRLDDLQRYLITNAKYQ